MYDYYLGGRDNYQADRVAAEAALGAAPELRAIARENRAFLRRAVRHLADSGVRQFIDIGAGLPTRENVHQVAQEIAPECRVVYVDNDPTVLVHARALLSTHPLGRMAVVQADVRDPERLLADDQVRSLIDFARPLAVLLVSVLQFVPDREPQDVVAPLRDAMPRGGHLVVSHPTQDFRAGQVGQVASTYHRAKAPAGRAARPRSSAPSPASSCWSPASCRPRCGARTARSPRPPTDLDVRRSRPQTMTIHPWRVIWTSLRP